MQKKNKLLRQIPGENACTFSGFSYFFRCQTLKGGKEEGGGGNWDLERERYTANSNQTSKGGGAITYFLARLPKTQQRNGFSDRVQWKHVMQSRK